MCSACYRKTKQLTAVENNDGALGDKLAGLGGVVCRGEVRGAEPEGVACALNLLDDGTAVRKVLPVVLSREAIAADDGVDLGVCASLDLRVVGEECEEPLNDGRGLRETTSASFRYREVDGPLLPSQHHQS